MTVTVRCPDCATTLRARVEQLGRQGQCAGCGLVFRLITPVGQRLADDETGAEADAPQVIEELPVLSRAPLEPYPLPDEDEDERPADRAPARRAGSPQQSPRVLLVPLSSFSSHEDQVDGCGIPTARIATRSSEQ